eukprot:m.95688 g.95688  ORF g.95688 m.95688 type:complete len:455 (+) comp13904_c0_seq5:177-1541(+)
MSQRRGLCAAPGLANALTISGKLWCVALERSVRGMCAETQREVFRLFFPSTPRCLSLSPCGSLLAIAVGLKLLIYHINEKQAPVRVCEERLLFALDAVHVAPVPAHPGLFWVVAGGSNGLVRRTLTALGVSKDKGPEHDAVDTADDNWLVALQYSADGRSLAAVCVCVHLVLSLSNLQGGMNGCLVIRDAASLEALFHARLDKAHITALSFSPTCTLLAAACTTDIHLFAAANGTWTLTSCLPLSRGPDVFCSLATWSLRGQWLAVAPSLLDDAPADHVLVFAVTSSSQLSLHPRAVRCSQAVRGLASGPSGLVVLARDGTVTVTPAWCPHHMSAALHALTLDNSLRVTVTQEDCTVLYLLTGSQPASDIIRIEAPFLDAHTLAAALRDNVALMRTPSQTHTSNTTDTSDNCPSSTSSSPSISTSAALSLELVFPWIVYVWVADRGWSVRESVT